MNIKLIIIVIIAILFVILITVPIISVYFKTRLPDSVNVNAKYSDNKKLCHKVPTECDTDMECATNCIDNDEYSCQLSNNGKKYCLPEKTAKTYTCNTNTGGVPVWTGWGSTNRMEWDCMCLYPQFFGGPGCSQTPGVCELDGDSYMQYDFSLGRPPQYSDCVLPKNLTDNGFTVQIREDKTPIIVSEDMKSGFYRYNNI